MNACRAGTKRLGTKRYRPHNKSVAKNSVPAVRNTPTHWDEASADSCTDPTIKEIPTPKDSGPNVSNAQYTKNCIIQGRCELTRQIRLNALSIVRISISDVTTSITLPIAVNFPA